MAKPSSKSLSKRLLKLALGIKLPPVAPATLPGIGPPPTGLGLVGSKVGFGEELAAAEELSSFNGVAELLTSPDFGAYIRLKINLWYYLIFK